MLKKNIGEYFALAILGAVLFVYFQFSGKFHFFFMEQFQLFQYTWSYLFSFIGDIGGFSTYLAHFLMQFFKQDYCGAIISSSLLVLIVLFINKILKRAGISWQISFLSIVVLLPLIGLHLDDYYNIAGTISFLLMLMSVNIVLNCKDRTSQLLIPVLSLFLFYISGSYAFQFLLILLLLKRTEKKLMVFVSGILLLMVLLGYVSLRTGSTDGFDSVFLFGLFYEPRLEAPVLIYLPFISLLMILGFLPVIENILAKKIIGIPAYAGLYPLIICLTGYLILSKGISEYSQDRLLKELDYYSQSEQWDEIIDLCYGEQENHLNMNYLNLALLQRGSLTEDMFSYDQRNDLSLLVSWDKSQLVSNLRSDIAFAAGQTALAQNMAFESLVNYKGSVSGRALKRLVETNLILGADAVSGKYLDILDKTLFYREWARKYRIYVEDRNELVNNPDLSRMIGSLSSINNLLGLDHQLQELINCINTNPNNTNVIEFTEAYMMLTRDLNSLKRFVETYYGTPVLPFLTKSMQEAVITYSEDETEYWLNHGVSNSIINRFRSFKLLVLENKDNPALKSTVRRYYGDTYWYFYMFKS